MYTLTRTSIVMELTINNTDTFRNTHFWHVWTGVQNSFRSPPVSAKRSFTEQLPEECGEKQSNPIINMFLWEESSLTPPPPMCVLRCRILIPFIIKFSWISPKYLCCQMRVFLNRLQAHHCDYLVQISLPLMHYYVHEFKHNCLWKYGWSHLNLGMKQCFYHKCKFLPK